jgi:hypothetical protein
MIFILVRGLSETSSDPSMQLSMVFIADYRILKLACHARVVKEH